MSAPLNSVGKLLFGQVRGRILERLYRSKDSFFFTRQIARDINASSGTTQRELETLTQAGLILRLPQPGPLTFYGANQKHPLFPELRSLIAKTFGILHLLMQALEPLSKSIEFAFLYGSFARGDETAQSDIDLMIIGDLNLDEVLEYLAPLEATLQRPINPTIYSSEELRTKLHAGHHFLASIQQGKIIFLIGNEHDFREIR